MILYITNQTNFKYLIFQTCYFSNDEIILMSSNDAKAKLDTMNPNPWPSDISFLRNTLKKVSKETKYNIVWIWDGINHDKQENVIDDTNRSDSHIIKLSMWTEWKASIELSQDFRPTYGS